MKQRFIHAWELLRETAIEWDKDNATRLGAALSYYTVFSLAPLLMLAVSVAGFFFGREAIQGELSSQLQGLIGKQGAEAVEGLIAGAWKPSSNVLATIAGVIALLIGATAVFTELRAVLNLVWDVAPQKINGAWALIKSRLLSFAMIGAIGFLLLVSLILNTALAMVSKYFSGIFPIPGFFAQLLYSGASFTLISLLFAAIFKVLPDKKVRWGDVWIGAVMTAALFTVGKFLIGLYLGRTSVASSYGASASLVLIMLWAYYSSLIFIFGAEFTQVYSCHFGQIQRDSALSSGRQL